MKNYYDLYVNNCLKFCTVADYGDKKKVSAHNRAQRKVRELQKEMKEENCLEVLKELLQHNDSRVKNSAGAMCLRDNIYVEEAIISLKSVYINEQDKSLKFSAGTLLKQYGITEL